MIVEFNRNVSDVDFGTFGKRTVNIHIKLKRINSGQWELFCYYINLVHKDGKMSPANSDLISASWIGQWVDDCINELKQLQGWKHG